MAALVVALPSWADICVCKRYEQTTGGQTIEVSQELFKASDPQRLRGCDDRREAYLRAPEIKTEFFNCRIVHEKSDFEKTQLEWTFGR